MFDISWSELLVLAVVTLLFVGPKELPAFLRTLGRYTGVVKRQAAEFRAHFDAAMREAEMEALKKDVEDIGRQASGALSDTMRALPSEKDIEARGRPGRRDTSNGLVTPPHGNEVSLGDDVPPPRGDHAGRDAVARPPVEGAAKSKV